MKATITCPSNVCVCGFFLLRVCMSVYACRRHLFVFRTTAAVNFAALCFVWSLLPSHSANAVFLLSVTLKPLWSTVYSRSFGTLCPSSVATAQWLNERRFLSTSFFLFLIIGIGDVLKQLFTWADELRRFGLADNVLLSPFSHEEVENRVKWMSFILIYSHPLDSIHSP